MINSNKPINDIEFLDARIEDILNNVPLNGNPDQECHPELETLLSTAEKIVSHAKKYPVTPSPTTQQRLELITAYRASVQKESDNPRKLKEFFAFFQFTTFRWAIAVGIALLITIGVLLSTPNGHSEILPGAAGQQTILFPIILLALIALGAALYFLFWRKK